MRVRYIGEHESTDAFGHVFNKNEWTDVSALPSERAELLSTNPQFDADEKAVRPEPESIDPAAPAV